MSLIKSDPTLTVGDYVFSSYHKGEYLFKIIEIRRRFLDASDLRYGVYENAKVGDEYDPLVKIQAVSNLSIVNGNKKKFRKISAEVDGSYLSKVSKDTIKDHITKLQKLIFDSF